jgi:hypothetical protein
MNKFYSTSMEEQETIINVDYFAKEVSCYTSRNSTYNRLFRKLGEPTKTYYTQEKISGANWIIPFGDKKRLASIFSRPTIIGSL